MNTLRNNLLYMILLFGISFSSYAQVQDDVYYTAPETTKITSPEYLKGVNEAQYLFRTSKKDKKTVFWVTAFGGPIAGLAALDVRLGDPPNNMMTQHPEYYDKFKNPDYYKGYAYEANRIKRKDLWLSYGIGTIASVAVTGILITYISSAR